MLYGCSPGLQGNLPKSRVEEDGEIRFILKLGIAAGGGDAAIIGYIISSSVTLVGIMLSFYDFTIILFKYSKSKAVKNHFWNKYFIPIVCTIST